MVASFITEEFASFDSVRTEFDKVTDEISKLKMNIEENESRISRLEFHESLLKNIIENVQDNELQTKLSALLEEYTTLHNIQEIRGTLQQLYSKKAELIRNVKLLFACSEPTNNSICSVCLDMSVDSFLKTCGHTFCTRCIARNKNLRCPQCRAEYVYTDVRSLVFS